MKPPYYPTVPDVLAQLEAAYGKDILLKELALWLEVDLTSDGWTVHNGGPGFPISGDIEVVVRMRGGTVIGPCCARALRWHHDGTAGDIVAYKVVP